MSTLLKFKLNNIVTKQSILIGLCFVTLTMAACSGGGSTIKPPTPITPPVVTPPPVTPIPVTPSPQPTAPHNTDLSGYGKNEVPFLAGKEFGEIGFFENVVIDNAPEELIADDVFNDETNDSVRLRGALNRASKETNGGVVILRKHPNGQHKYSLAHIQIPSNTRLEIEPSLVLEMRGQKETTELNKRFLFSFGRSNGPNNLSNKRVENVEVTSTDPTQNFTVDAKTNMPFDYGQMVGGNGGGTVNLTRAIPFALFYVRNFSISNVTVQDNHTESVSVQMFADTDYKDGAFAWRFGSKAIFLEDRYDNQGGANTPMNPINIPLATNSNDEFIDDNNEVVSDMFAIQRNATYGRTPIKGSIKNIKALNVHTGYGVVQVYGGDWIEIDNIEAFNGIGVRVEAGNGTDNDNYNRAGPYLHSSNKIKISNVKVTNGFTGVYLKTHSKILKDISVENIEAIDSGSALMIDRGSFACKTSCRDLTRGRMNNLSITGTISLRQTIYDEPVAEVGNVATYLLSLSNREYIAQRQGKTVTTIGRADLDDSKNPSGTRWYFIFPTAPVLLMNQLSETDIGDESSKVGFYGVSLEQANIVQIGLALGEGETERPNVLYRSNMQFPNGDEATDFINK